MKKATLIIGILLSIIIAFVVSVSSNDNKTNIVNGITTINICKDYYIEKVDSVKHNLFFCENYDLDGLEHVKASNKSFIESNKYIIKYSFDGKNIAYHLNELVPITKLTSNLYVRTVNATEYGVLKDLFIIYDIKNQKKTEFDSQDEFINYCNKMSLDLFDWKFVSGIDFENIVLNENCTLKMSKSISVPDQFIYNNKVVLEGYIFDYETKENIIEFRIKVPNVNSLEFPQSSNLALKVGEKSIGKHLSGWVLLFPIYSEIYFDEVVIVNMLNGSIQKRTNTMDGSQSSVED